MFTYTHNERSGFVKQNPRYKNLQKIAFFTPKRYKNGSETEVGVRAVILREFREFQQVEIHETSALSKSPQRLFDQVPPLAKEGFREECEY